MFVVFSLSIEQNRFVFCCSLLITLFFLSLNTFGFEFNHNKNTYQFEHFDGFLFCYCFGNKFNLICLSTGKLRKLLILFRESSIPFISKPRPFADIIGGTHLKPTYICNQCNVKMEKLLCIKIHI